MKIQPSRSFLWLFLILLIGAATAPLWHLMRMPDTAARTSSASTRPIVGEQPAAAVLGDGSDPTAKDGSVPKSAPRAELTASARALAVAKSSAAHTTGVPELDAFNAWTARYLAASGEERKALVDEGITFATERRVALAKLIPSDPRRAIESAVPPVVRQELPGAIAARLEERVNEKAFFGVLGVVPSADAPDAPAYRREVRTDDGGYYRAFVYGNRGSQPTTASASIVGIAVDDVLAVDERPLRIVASGEIPNHPNNLTRRRTVVPLDEQGFTLGREVRETPAPARSIVETCPVSGKSTAVPKADDGGVAAVTEEQVVVEAGGQIHFLCSGGHILGFEGDLIAQEGGNGGPSKPTNPPSATQSTGYKSHLLIRVAFPEALKGSVTEKEGHDLGKNVQDWFADTSFGAMSFLTTVTPLIVLPRSEPWYKDKDTGSAFEVLTDARAAAKLAGFDPAYFDFDTVIYTGTPGGFSGQAYVGGKGCWLKSGTSTGVAAHEYGHNFGLWHSNFWSTTNGSVIGGGSHVEYGDNFDTMGSASAGDLQFNAFQKNLLNWIPTAVVHDVSASGTYRIYPMDQPAQDPSLRYAMKIRKDAARNYWVDLRQRFATNAWVQGGVFLHWSPWQPSGSGPHLLDATPGSPDGKNDAPLVVGRTFSDVEAGVHITPIAKNATSPASMDVVVNIGSFAGNQAPTVGVSAGATSVATGVTVNFTATASDPDGDALSYAWDFGDKSFSTSNSPAVSKSWAAAGEYRVRCTVSDMKGQTASSSVIVTVGSPTTFRIAGTITAGGLPLRDVRVSASSREAYTDSDGTYTLVGLAAGSYTVGTQLYGYTLAATGSANVTVGPNASGVNFTATNLALVSIAVQDGDCSEGANTGTFRISRTGSTASALTVNCNYPGGTAVKPTDYSLAPDVVYANPYYTFTIPAGQAFLDVVLTAVADGLQESFETARLELFPSTNYVLGNSSATITIADSNTALPLVRMQVSDRDAFESGDPGQFVIERLGSTTSSLAVSVALSGTATNGTDYVTIPATITIPAGASSVPVNVTPLQDSIIEGLETVTLTINTNAGYIRAASSLEYSGTVNLYDDDVPTITVVATDSTAAEAGNDPGVFTVTRTGSTSQPLTVNYGLTGSALHGTDYVALPGVLTIPAGSSIGTVVITPIDDDIGEPAQTAVLYLRSGTGYIVGSASSATVTITDNADLPNVAIDVTSAPAVESGTTGTFRITTTGTGSGNITVKYTVTGTATNGVDYSFLSGTVTMAKNTTSNITITPIQDVEVEGYETITITLSPDPAYAIGLDSSASMILQDDELPQVSVSITNDAFSETNGSLARFFVSRTGATTSALTVNYTLGGTATAGLDYTAPSGTVTIAAGATGTYVDVSMLADSIVEGTETIILNVTPGAAYAPGIGSATRYIIDAQSASVATQAGFSASSGSASENAGTVNIPVTLNAASANTVTVEYFVNGGTALGGGVDYQLAAGVLTFAPGSTVKNIAVQIMDDTVVESSETLIIGLANPVNSRLGTSSYTLTITDNDSLPTPTVGFAAASSSGLESVSPAQIAVFLSRAQAGTVSVNYAVTGGTATNGIDYTITNGTLTFAAGETVKIIPNTITDDDLFEPNETIILALSSPVGASLSANTTHTYTIINDDVTDTTPPAVTVTPSGTVTGNSPITFTLTFSEPVSGLTANGVTVTNGAKGTLAGSGSVYTIPVVPSGQGPVTCRVNASAAQDAAGNNNTASNTASVTYDTVAPTVTVSPSGTSTATSPITFTLTFSEPVSGLAASGITVTNGTKGTLAGSGTTYTIPVTPSGQGPVTCQVNASAAQDAAGNNNTVSNTASVTYDTVAPTVTVSPSGTSTATSPITFTLTFSEPVSGLAASGITVANGTKGTLAGSGTTYTIPVTPSGQGPVTCQVNASAAQDAAGNNNTASNTASVTYDTVAPTATVSPSGTSTSTSPITFTLTFSEPVSGLAASGITVANGTKGALAGGGAIYTIPVTPSGEGAVTCEVSAGAAADAAANASTASNTASVIYDTTAPTVTVTPSGTSTGTSPITFTLTFSESVTGLSAAGITVTNGSAGALAGSGNTYTIPVTPAAQGAVTCQVNAGAAMDAAANASTASNTASVIYDNIAPTVAISSPSVTATGIGPVTFEVTYADANFNASTLAAGDISLNRTGTADGIVGVSGTGTTRTVTVSGITGNGTLGISIAGATATDTAGNTAGAAGPSATFTVANDATLSGLTLSTGALTPAFAPGTIGYTASVSNTTTSVTVTPTVADGTATVKVNGATVPSGTASGAISLVVGANPITILVTAQDFTTTKTYTLTVTRASVPATVQFTSASQSASESVGTMTITAQLSEPSGVAVTVPFTVTGTASNPADYTISASPLTIPAGQTSANITITVVDDSVNEANETVIVTMGTPVGATKGTPSAHTATIIDNDRPTVQFTSASQSALESAGALTVTALLSAPTNVDVTVPFTVTGTASNPADYTITSSPLTIPAGQTTATITITVVDDSVNEANETVIVTIGTPVNATKGATSAHTATIIDNDRPTVQFTSASQSALESVGTMTVTAQLSFPTNVDVTVPFTITGSASNPADYTITSSPLIIPAGQTSANITITVVDDALQEANETVNVNMGAPVNANKGAPATHAATIIDNDRPIVQFTSASQSALESVGTMTVTAQLSFPTDLAVTVPFTVAGTASNPADYTITASPLTIPAGQTTASVTIAVVDDALAETNETVIVIIGTPVNATKGATATHTATITDNDSQPTVQFTSASQSALESVGTMTVTAQLSAPSGQAVTVPFTVSGTASKPSDYTITASPVTIPAGQTTATITITVVNDAVSTPDETVIITMGTPTNAIKGATTVHTATIIDNDPWPTVQFTSASQSALESAGTMTVTAQLSAPTIQDVTVPFTVAGTASNPADYTRTASPLVIPTGQTSASITLTLVDDAVSEASETIIITMGTPVGAIKGATLVHTATIIDNDNADLASLVPSVGTLMPVFASATISYSAGIPSGTAAITVTPTVANSNATVTVNGVPVTSGQPSGPISLSVGLNTITTVVTALNGTTKKTYTLLASRAGTTNADLLSLVPSVGTLSPVFSIGTLAYSTSVTNSTLSIQLTPAPVDPLATVTVNGAAVTSGTASAPITLYVGSNGIDTVVTAPDGTTKKTYKLTVNVTVNPAVAGYYTGLATPTAASTNPARQVGMSAVSVTSTGEYTGKITLGGSATPVVISGTLASGAATTDIVRAGLPTLTLTLTLAGDVITGTLIEGATEVSTLALNKLLYTATVPAVAPLMNVPLAVRNPATGNGAYTAILQALTPAEQGLAATAYPQGSGWVTLSVATSGLVTVSGKLGDGQAVSYSNYLSKDNVLPFFISPHAGTGTVSGLVSFRDIPGQTDVDGQELIWFKAANASDTSYRNGWPAGIKVDLFGSKFIAPSLANVGARMFLTDGNLASAATNHLSVNAASQVTVISSTLPGGNLVVTLATNGSFSGTFVHPVSNKSTALGGVILQKTQSGSGYFLGLPATGTVSQSGAVTISVP
jgi:hypothetical protein